MKIVYQKTLGTETRRKLSKVVEGVLLLVKNQPGFLGNIQVTFKETKSPEGLANIGGIGGFCNNKNEVTISLDLANVDSISESNIMKTLLHELYHTKQLQSGKDITKGTLSDFFVNEGEADKFVEDVTGEKPIWQKNLTQKEYERLWSLVQQDLEKEVDDNLYAKWFTGGDKKLNIPRFAGYWLGYRLVKNNLTKKGKQ